MSARIQSWELLFALEDLPYQSHLQIDAKYFQDPNQKFTKAILRLYSPECWLYNVLNEACRDQDKTKIKTLGPFAYCLSFIMQSSQIKRDLNDQISPGSVLYRGIKLPLEYENEIQEFKDKIGKLHYFNKLTSTSTSLD